MAERAGKARAAKPQNSSEARSEKLKFTQHNPTREEILLKPLE